MATISTRIIEGPFFSPIEYTTCAMESETPSQPPLEESQLTFTLDQCRALDKQFENTESFISTHSFWKQRIIIQMLISPHILSVSFIPKEYRQPQILFIQKTGQTPTVQKFNAPYFSEKMQEYMVSTASPSDKINAATLNESIKGMDAAVHTDIQKILRFFLEDQKTRCLGLTYFAVSGELISRCWSKV